MECYLSVTGEIHVDDIFSLESVSDRLNAAVESALNDLGVGESSIEVVVSDGEDI